MKIVVVDEPGLDREALQTALTQLGVPVELKVVSEMEAVAGLLSAEKLISFQGQKIGANGIVFKDGKEWVVRVPNKSKYDGKTKAFPDGVTCPNPEAPFDEQIIEKRFARKQIYLQSQFEEARVRFLGGPNFVSYGPTGYSNAKAALNHVQPMQYEYAVKGVFGEVVRSLCAKIRGIKPALTNGASGMGVDLGVIQLGKEQNISMLGFSCPEFMLYVEDDDLAVVVCNSQSEYSDHFVRATDVLIALNGRKQAFGMDIAGMMGYQRPVITIDLMRALSPIGKAGVLGPNGEVEDAVGLFLGLHHTPPVDLYHGADAMEKLAQYVATTCVNLARHSANVSPDRKFENLTPITVSRAIA